MNFLYVHSRAGLDERRVSSLAAEVFRTPTQFRLEDAVFVVDGPSRERCLVRGGTTWGYVSGYVRQHALPADAPLAAHNQAFMRELSGSWPLSDDFTGSFAAIAIDDSRARVVIANDPIGLYPLYYYRDDESLIVSSSLVLIGGLVPVPYDPTGLIQCLSGPDYCNVGSRTMLKHVFRLLPGEWIAFNTGGATGVEKKYDFSLYQGIKEPSLASAAREIKALVEREVEIATRFDHHVSIAASGGLDSRLLMAATPTDKDVSCVTYGGDDEYETGIARATASIRGGCTFRNFPVGLSHQFPRREQLAAYVRETEGVGINDWFAILEQQPHEDRLLLVGDMTESIMGRNILANKGARLSHFWKIAQGQPIVMAEADAESVEHWKAAKLSAITKALTTDTDTNRPFLAVEEFLTHHGFAVTIDDVMNDYAHDMAEIFTLISQHRLPAIPLMDELFAWYLHGRIAMGRQILLTNYSYFSVSPSMSMGMLRAVSRMHPSLRAYSRLMHAAFRSNSTWRKYAKLATPAAPLVPQASPLIAVMGINALRYKADVWLARRLMKRKVATLRPRIMRCSSWPLIYSQMDGAIVERWFQPNHLGAFADRCTRMLARRKSLDAWPLAMFDVSSIAAVNIQMDTIRGLRHVRH